MVAQYTNMQKACFGAFIVGGVCTLSPLFAAAMQINSAIIPLSVIMTLGTFGGASLYAMNQPIGRFDSWGPALYGVLVTTLVMNLCAAGGYYFYGPNMFSNTVFSIYPYFGLGLFTAFQMFDTQLAIRQYKDGMVDVLSHSINFILNMKNMLINFMQIFMRWNE